MPHRRPRTSSTNSVHANLTRQSPDTLHITLHFVRHIGPSPTTLRQGLIHFGHRTLAPPRCVPDRLRPPVRGLLPAMSFLTTPPRLSAISTQRRASACTLLSARNPHLQQNQNSPCPATGPSQKKRKRMLRKLGCAASRQWPRSRQSKSTLMTFAISSAVELLRTTRLNGEQQRSATCHGRVLCQAPSANPAPSPPKKKLN